MKVLLAWATALCSVVAHGQYWRALGRGTVGPTEVQTLFSDSATDRLLAGGTFRRIMNENDTVLGMGQAVWNGYRWDSLATRVQPNSGGELVQQTFWFLRFDSDLYACGGFSILSHDSVWSRAFARLDEQLQKWEALECTNSNLSGLSTLVPKLPGANLYATGWMGSLCGYPESCVFRYDGNAFHTWEPFNQIPQDNGNYVGLIFDFQGMTYLTGSVRDPLGPGDVTFLRYNGTAWEHVPGWNTQSPIKEVFIHNDTLYVAGAFRYATGGPGNLIARFDGENWNDMGSGLAYTAVPMSGTAWDMKWWHGKLLVSGFFSQAGGVPCSSIAQWNGHQWCSLPGDIRWNFNSQPTISEMAIWRDSLYICGGINTIDGDTIRQVAQWIGGDAMGECSEPTGLAEVKAPGLLAVTALAEPGTWQVTFPSPGQWVVCAYDAMGRLTRSWTAQRRTLDVDLSREFPGLYLLRAVNSADNVLFTKLVR